jgi:hypothetical protein
MGPITIFDKSALQALSIDETVWLEAYFPGWPLRADMFSTASPVRVLSGGSASGSDPGDRCPNTPKHSGGPLRSHTGRQKKGRRGGNGA